MHTSEKTWMFSILLRMLLHTCTYISSGSHDNEVIRGAHSCSNGSVLLLAEPALSLALDAAALPLSSPPSILSASAESPFCS